MESDPQANLRLETRNNIFVVAVLFADGQPGMPVRVRDVSGSGAQVEAANLPPLGTRVTLVRGDRSVAGRIAWNRSGRAGLSLVGPVHVPDWLPNARRGAIRSPLAEPIPACRSDRPASINPGRPRSRYQLAPR